MSHFIPGYTLKTSSAGQKHTWVLVSKNKKDPPPPPTTGKDVNAAARRVRRRPRAFMTGSGSSEEEGRWGEQERGVAAYTWKLGRQRSYGWRGDSEKELEQAAA